jgi:hypothetical protein
VRAATAISVPGPVAGDLRDLLADNPKGSSAIARHPIWLFAGSPPSRPIAEHAAAIVSDLLGVHIATATQ